MPDSGDTIISQDTAFLAAGQEPGQRLGFRRIPNAYLSLSIQFLDVLIILGCGLLCRFWLQGVHQFAGNGYDAIDLTAALICHFSFAQARLYTVEALFDEISSIRTIIGRWSVIFLLIAAVSALSHSTQEFSRVWYCVFYAVGMMGLILARVLVANAVRMSVRRGFVTRSVVVYGERGLAIRFRESLETNPYGIKIVGVFGELPGGISGAGGEAETLPGLSALLDFTRRNPVDTVVLTLPITETGRIEAAIRLLREQPMNIRLLPGELGLDRIRGLRMPQSDLPGVHLLQVVDRPISDLALLFKGALDRVGASLALILAAPLFLACAIGIKCQSPGPVFFRQKRVGYKGQIFEIFKFRTMHVAETPYTKLTDRNDPRVFPFGGILRKLSLDELPQLLNVLRGEMSLVGPRPHMPEARAAGKLYFEAVDEYSNRARVKPGITGWAQVNGWRGPTQTIEQIERRVEHDLYYIENWSLSLDLVILFRTVLVGFFGRNAF